MFPLLQIRISELPYVPEHIAHIALLVLFHDLNELAFERPHGEGWLIREYATLHDLAPLPKVAHQFRPFPVRWSRIDDDLPAWVGYSHRNVFNDYPQTKVGGYPAEVQHDAFPDGYVFQVASEEKVRWAWGDGGIAYFFRKPCGEWSRSCQFY